MSSENDSLSITIDKRELLEEENGENLAESIDSFDKEGDDELKELVKNEVNLIVESAERDADEMFDKRKEGIEEEKEGKCDVLVGEEYKVGEGVEDGGGNEGFLKLNNQKDDLLLQNQIEPTLQVAQITTKIDTEEDDRYIELESKLEVQRVFYSLVSDNYSKLQEKMSAMKVIVRDLENEYVAQIKKRDKIYKENVEVLVKKNEELKNNLVNLTQKFKLAVTRYSQMKNEKKDYEEIIIRQEEKLNNLVNKLGKVEEIINNKNRIIKENELYVKEFIKIVESQKNEIKSLKNSTASLTTNNNNYNNYNNYALSSNNNNTGNINVYKSNNVKFNSELPAYVRNRQNNFTSNNIDNISNNISKIAEQNENYKQFTENSLDFQSFGNNLNNEFLYKENEENNKQLSELKNMMNNLVV